MDDTTQKRAEHVCTYSSMKLSQVDELLFLSVSVVTVANIPPKLLKMKCSVVGVNIITRTSLMNVLRRAFGEIIDFKKKIKKYF